MADTESDLPDNSDNTASVPGDETGEVPAKKTEMTVPEMRQWLRNWVGKAVGQSPDAIDESIPMVELGLSSRDAVAMAADIEDMTGVMLSVAVAFQHPTIESLATRIIEGEPERPDDDLDGVDWTRSGPAERVDIAIVGLATRLPGDMNSPDETWQALMEGRDAITDLPEGRWSEFLEEPRLAERVAAARTRGGYLKDIKGFDSEFFAVAKTEADNIDPQQRLALEMTWEALEHARIPASSLRGEAVGVYVGFTNNDYGFLAISDPTVAHPYAITGNSTAIIANRVSYFYDFRGPSVAVDTACSSSLVATHQAVQALRNGECDVAVAGGVNALITPAVTLGFDEIGAVLAPDGRIKSFSSDADGYTRSEGAGMLVLKRVDDARRDGDQILAVIAGSAINHDGRSNGLIAPNQDAQAEVLRRAYKDAGINPRTVDYIEAHGTGTILGDPIEAEALGRVVGRGRQADQPALLGAIKTNIGHLESAAGVAAMAKVVLSLQHDKLPPSINFAGPSPYIDFDGMHLKVVDTATDWPRYGGFAVAGVSSFGFGGANAHLVVREVLPGDVAEREPEPAVAVAAEAEQAQAPALEAHSLNFDDFGNIITDDFVGDDAEPELPGVTEEALALKKAALEELAAQEDSEPTKPLIPLAVSAFLTSRKKTAAAELADWIQSPEGQAASLESIGRSLSRRNHGRSRAVVLAHDHEEAVKGLRAVADGKQRPGVFSVDGPVTNGPVWVLAGFGAQHRKMGKSLYLRDAVFAEWIEKVDALVQDELGYSVLELILDDSQDYGIETTQVTIFAIQIALGELLKHHGAKPAAVVGQSLGEAASAYFAGGLSLRDATRAICSRSHLMGEGEAMLFGEYIRLMALVEYSADEVKTVFSDFPDLEVCVYAAPTQTVIGGPPEQVDAIIARAESEGKFARKFETKGASHTQQMDPLLGELTAELQGIKPLSPTAGIFSTVHEGSYIKPGSEPIHDVDYWKKGLRHSVYFTHGIRNAVDSGHTTFLELAPNPVALMQVGLTTADAGLHDAQLIPTLARKQDEVESITTTLAQLYVFGHDLDIRTMFSRAKEPQDYANIPPTRFKRKEHWLDAHFAGDGSVMMPGNHVALPDGRHVWEYAPRDIADLAALVRSAATAVLPDAKLTASEQRAVPGPGARLVTTLTRHPGGASVQVHARIDESFTLVYDALVARGDAPSVLPTAVGAGTALTAGTSVADTTAAPVAEGLAEDDDAETLTDSLTNRYLSSDIGRWSPDSGETIAVRLGTIVSAAMGYEPEDLPWEVPLIELGLDSLMAVRIKNRVEYDFDLPPIQLTAVRDANLYAVEQLIEYAIEHRDEVQELHEHQKTLTADEIAKEQAQLLSGAAPTPGPDASDAPIPPPPTDPSGPSTNGAKPNLAGAAEALSQETVAKALNSDVPPRDAAERVTFATWAIVTGKSPGGIFNPLPKLDDATAARMAQRLAERAEGPISAEDVLTSQTIEALAEKVRAYFEAGQIDGFVRTLRARPDDDSKVPVFVFHPAGGSTVVYEPLLNRLPADTPMYGFERVEGTVQERAAQYVPKLLEMNEGKPFILAGWSLGGALAYACAIGLKQAGADVRFVGMIDTVRAGEEIPQTKEETRKRWDRYAKFAERTFNVEIPGIPYEQLEELDDEGQVKFVLDIVQQSGVQVPGGIVEHQRTSYLDNRALETVEIEPYDGHVTLYMADRYHDDVIEFEPRYAVRKPDGGWGEYVADLEVVPIGGEHIQAIDEPIIGKVGAHLAEVLNKVEAQTSQTSEVGK
ncbi:polyketide synthase [Mycobacterium montefiorense]|uniref:Polyketide synthase n=2 Tax=Mycobacterium montefiorense TaxID=154654 RepID=A0AA37PL37_9MYCO|nr:polyketide synthase [Mycobacterium montefiorense]GKU33493.1 polyketide synthase [Mycobacterium montefiorense]GKU39988.1 polyketide synthase [Mycobacterium montefiorense]GKU45324.1 polyketide synthase [Mycobacterium montefiorense]GKU49383.1 polyketide synthase [Mycobacterium montefiorense]